MNKNGSIIVIEDDLDDQEIMREIFVDLGMPNILRFFQYLLQGFGIPFIHFGKTLSDHFRYQPSRYEWPSIKGRDQWAPITTYQKNSLHFHEYQPRPDHDG